MKEYTLTVEPILDGLQPSHPAHRAATMELLNLSPKPTTEVLTGSPGSKGVSQDLVWQLAPSAPVVAGALVRAWRLWLQRDRRRSLRVTLNESGAPKREILVDGENISLETLESAIGAVLDRDDEPVEHVQDSE